MQNNYDDIIQKIIGITPSPQIKCQLQNEKFSILTKNNTSFRQRVESANKMGMT